MFLECFFRSKTWLCLNFQDIGLCRPFLMLIYTLISCYFWKVPQNQWHIVGKVSSFHILVLPLIWGFHFMPGLASVHSGTWPDSWLCSFWRDTWCCIVAWLSGIESWWGVFNTGLRSRASLGSSVTQWSFGLYWQPGSCLLMPPSTIVARLSNSH